MDPEVLRKSCAPGIVQPANPQLLVRPRRNKRALRWLAFTGLVLLLPVLLSSFSPGHNGPPTAHFDGERFSGPGSALDNKVFFDFVRMTLTKDPATVGRWPERDPVQTTQPLKRVQKADLRVTYVGHATFLIQTEGLNILTDPFYSERASPVTWAGPKRVAAPGIAWGDLPPIDVILISHGHYDHLDQWTLKRLWTRFRPQILTPLGHRDTIGSDTASVELDWGGRHEVKGVSFVLTPMQHWSARSLFDRNRALWGAWVIKARGGSIYFLGDSGYGSGAFLRTAEAEHGPFRLALLPIGAYKPTSFMAFSHMSPAEAVKSREDLGRPFALAHQHETIDMADEAYDEPRRDLESAKAAAGIDSLMFIAPRVAETFEIPPLDARGRKFCDPRLFHQRTYRFIPAEPDGLARK